MRHTFYVLMLIFLLNACKNDDDRQEPDQVICTADFRTVTLQVNGTALTDFYTLRPSTGEIIRMDYQFEENTYPVLDDAYADELLNAQDGFNFIGIIDGNIVLTEGYVIKADACHIEKVSGPEAVTLD